MAASHFHSLLEIYELKYRQQLQILLTSDLGLHDTSMVRFNADSSALIDFQFPSVANKQHEEDNLH